MTSFEKVNDILIQIMREASKPVEKEMDLNQAITDIMDSLDNFRFSLYDLLDYPAK